MMSEGEGGVTMSEGEGGVMTSEGRGRSDNE